MSKIQQIKSEKQNREFTVIKSAINIENRTVEIAFSSEEIIDRWFGKEILDHNHSSVNLTRLNNKAQYLFNHNADHPIGVVERAWIDSDKKGRALVRFSRREEAEKIFIDVCDGIISHVSVGYSIEEIKLDSNENGIETYRVLKWTPFELSQVTIPADISVGVGRSFENGNESRQIEIVSINNIAGRDYKMTEEEKQKLITEGFNAGVMEESKRVAEITKLGKDNKCEHLVNEAIANKRSSNEFMAKVLEYVRTKTTELADNGELFGVSKKELRQFSILRAMQYIDSHRRSDASFEVEFSEHMQKQLRRSTSGLLIPTQLMSRAFSTKEGSGAGLVQDTLSFDDFIPLIRSQTILSRLGAKWLTGLIGTFSLPKQTAGSNCFWIDEGENRPDKLSNFATGQTKLSPRTVAAATDVTRKMLLQTSFDVENFIIKDLTKQLALEIDNVALNGASEPTLENVAPKGILNLAGIGKLSGESLTYKDVIELYTTVADKDVYGEANEMAYLANPLVSMLLKTTPMFTGQGIPIWQHVGATGEGLVAGNRALESNLVRTTKNSNKDRISSLIYGKWADLLIGEWGVLDMIRDPYSNSLSGDLRIRVMLDIDVAVRYEESFAVRSGIKI